MHKLSLLFAVMLLSQMASAQPVLRVKGLNPNVQRTRIPAAAPNTRTPGRSHWLLQFAHNPSRAELEKLASRGAVVLSYIPDFAFSVVLPDGAALEGLDLQWMGRLRRDEKISAELEGKLTAPTAVLVEFHPDVDSNDGRAIVNDAGLRILENPDLLPRHLLVRGTREQILALADWDEVAYIFPASKDLMEGTPVRACAGAMTSQGPVGQAIPLIGEGWDGPGLGSANLKYVFDDVTAKLPAGAAEAEIARAFSEWAKYAQVSFTPASDRNGNQTIAILFGIGAHGDAYPFQGTSVVAHTFYPFPVNPEPIAGDMHFNDAQRWRIGAGLDIFSVALHEAGHALGMGHSDKPGDVMYPYYRKHTVLMPNDIRAVQELYAARSNASNPNPQPAPAPVSTLRLVVVAPPGSTTESSIAISGTTSGGSGAVQVSWTTSGGASGVAQGSSNWSIATVPLSAGDNVITVTAQDSRQNVVTDIVTVSSQPADPNPPPPPNPAPPAGPDTTSPSLTILSPATNNYTTSSDSLVVSGAATDNVGVTTVTWATSNGTSGTAGGTANWSTPSIPVYVGTTTIVITASDAAGNTSWSSLTVTRN